MSYSPACRPSRPNLAVVKARSETHSGSCPLSDESAFPKPRSGRSIDTYLLLDRRTGSKRDDYREQAQWTDHPSHGASPDPGSVQSPVHGQSPVVVYATRPSHAFPIPISTRIGGSAPPLAARLLRYDFARVKLYRCLTPGTPIQFSISTTCRHLFGQYDTAFKTALFPLRHSRPISLITPQPQVLPRQPNRSGRNSDGEFRPLVRVRAGGAGPVGVVLRTRFCAGDIRARSRLQPESCHAGTTSRPSPHTVHPSIPTVNKTFGVIRRAGAATSRTPRSGRADRSVCAAPGLFYQRASFGKRSGRRVSRRVSRVIRKIRRPKQFLMTLMTQREISSYSDPEPSSPVWYETSAGTGAER